MHAATRPGATFGDVFAVAQAAYADAGFPDEWRDHHQGGSIGYQPRERVALPGDPTTIESGMAFAWNPSIAGAKAEDTIVIADGAARTVTGG
jgi:Xaa-Pro aminopeptidase